MNIIKKYVTILIVISISTSLCAFNPRQVYAQEKVESYSAQYSGLYNGSDDFEFDILSVDIDGTFFTGHIYINGLFVIDKAISGIIAFYDKYYTCSFNFTYRYIATYTASFEITVYPSQGIAYGSGGGGFLFFDDNFPLTGTVDKFYNKNLFKLYI